ncbi:MAG: restriction endonuclease subunit S, partial [Blastocatellia bacterium]|nr:restriction endonuclease subunit S [Blastocatellia bacterium]
RIARVSAKHVKQLSRHILHTGDVVYSRRGDVTRFAVVTEKEEGWLCGTGSIRIRLNSPDIDIGYVRRYLQQEGVGNWLKQQAKGITMLNLNTEIIRAIPFVYPPLAEQQRIAAILDKADALREKRRQALAKLDALLQSVFLEMFGDGNLFYFASVPPNLPAHGKGWPWAKLTDIAKLATGHTPSRRVPEYWGGDIPWISLTDIRNLDGRVARTTSEFTNEEGINNSASVKLPAGTVCFSRTASVGFVTMMGREMATSQDFVNWVSGPDLNPTYLMWALIYSRHRLKELSTGSIHKTIYFPTVEEFQILLPPLPLQEKFAEFVDKHSLAKQQNGQSLRPLDDLFYSLQQRAFNGELFTEKAAAAIQQELFAE